MDTQETRIYTIVLIICLTIGTSIIYFFISVIRQQRRHLGLQKKMMLTELNAIEKERGRIARDLHDQINPVLAVVRFYIDSVQPVNQEDQQHLLEASSYVDDMIHAIREISNDLMPSTLMGKGLVAAINEYIERTQETTPFKIEFHSDQPIPIPPQYSVNLYRIIQEVIHNCKKHAGATLLQIALLQSADSLQVDIKDNGKGFDCEAVLRDSKGFGILSLRNRAEVMGGTMLLESKPGTGTAYRFKIPVQLNTTS